MKFAHLFYLSFFATAITGCSNELNEEFSNTDNQTSFKLAKSSGSIGDGNSIETYNNLEFKILFYKADKSSTLSNDSPINFENFYFIYEVDGWKTVNDFNDYEFTITNDNLSKFVYKMVVIATAKSKHEIDFVKEDPDSDGKSWLTDLKINRINEEGALVRLGKDNYICSKQITSEIINSGVVDLSLERIVGQLIFDVGRYDTGNNAISLDAGYGSTLDRVFNLNFNITNYTESIFWFSEGESDASQEKTVREIETENENPESGSYNISNYFIDNSYIMDSEKLATEPNGNVGILVNDECQMQLSPIINTGTTRIYGPYQFANSSGNLKVDIIFDYYDTVIPNNPEKALTLSLPKEGQKITTAPNYYTYSKIKITENRIIDVPVNFGNLQFEHEWDNY